VKITLDNISPLDILAIAAHRDDVEQTCGGTLLRMAQRGQRTGILDLTQGEMGTRGTAEERAQEAAEAARILRVSWRQALDIPDGRVENSFENRLKVARVIREQRPRVVILPYWEGRHPDHYTASTVSYTHLDVYKRQVGFFVVWTTERVLADPRWRLLVVVGFCGSFTTFSSYAFETMAYFEQGQWLLMLTNVLTNNLLCLGGALAGMALARVL